MQVNVMVSCGRGGCAVTWPCPVVPDGDPGARAEPEQRRLLLRLRPRRLCCRLCRRPVPPPPPTLPPTLPPSFYLYLWLLLLLYYYCNHTVKQLKCLVESCVSGELYPAHGRKFVTRYFIKIANFFFTNFRLTILFMWIGMLCVSIYTLLPQCRMFYESFENVQLFLRTCARACVLDLKVRS